MSTARRPSAAGAVELYYEEPALFNQHVVESLTSVEGGRWGAYQGGRQGAGT